MAKGNTGGKLAGNVVIGSTAPTLQAVTNNAQILTNQAQIQNATPTPGSGIAAFMAMDDQQKADIIKQAMNLPNFNIGNEKAPDTVLQKLSHILGIDSAPQLALDTDLDKMKGDEMFRVFHSSTQAGSDTITANIMMDNETFYSDSGGSVYGRGIYFQGTDAGHNADRTLSDNISMYGRGTNSNIVRAKFNSNAKVAKLSDIDSAVRSEIVKGTKFGQMLQRIDSADRRAIMAISKGYNVIKGTTITDKTYNVVIDRSALTMSYTYHRVTDSDRNAAYNGNLKWKNMNN